MDPDLGLFLVVSTVGFLAAGTLSLLGQLNGYWARLLERTAYAHVARLEPGLGFTHGSVQLLDDQTCESPLRGRRCVFYRFKVRELRRYGRVTFWRTVVDDSSRVPFRLVDATGEALVNLAGAEVELKSSDEAGCAFLQPAPPELVAALRRYRQSSEGRFFRRTLRCQEWTLCAGDQLSLLGLVDVQYGVPTFRAGGELYLASDGTREELSTKLQTHATGYWIAALVALVTALAAPVAGPWLVQ